MKPRANRMALMVASVPDVTSLTCSSDGTSSHIFSAMLTLRQLLRRSPDLLPVVAERHHCRVAMAEDQRAVSADIIHVAVIVAVYHVSTIATLNKQRITTHFWRNASNLPPGITFALLKKSWDRSCFILIPSDDVAASRAGADLSGKQSGQMFSTLFDVFSMSSTLVWSSSPNRP